MFQARPGWYLMVITYAVVHECPLQIGGSHTLDLLSLLPCDKREIQMKQSLLDHRRSQLGTPPVLTNHGNLRVPLANETGPSVCPPCSRTRNPLWASVCGDPCEGDSYYHVTGVHDRSLCRWRYRLTRNFNRFPRDIIEALLVENRCDSGSGEYVCNPITHHIPVLLRGYLCPEAGVAWDLARLVLEKIR